MIKGKEIEYFLSLVRAGLWTVHNEAQLYESSNKNVNKNFGSIKLSGGI